MQEPNIIQLAHEIGRCKNLIRSKNYREIERLLSEITARQTVIEMVLYLRVFSPVKTKLKNWYAARNGVQCEIARRGLNGDRILQGLF